MHHLTPKILKNKNLVQKIYNRTALIHKNYQKTKLPAHITSPITEIYNSIHSQQENLAQIQLFQTENQELLKLTKDVDEINEIKELMAEFEADLSVVNQELELLYQEIVSKSIEIFPEWAENSVLASDEDKLEIMGCKVQIIGGAGGLEAQIFGNELLEGYKNYLANNDWEYEILKEDEDGTLSSDNNLEILQINSPSAFQYLKLEHGVHRVQRIPFNSDRIQTSTCAVNIEEYPNF